MAGAAFCGSARPSSGMTMAPKPVLGAFGNAWARAASVSISATTPYLGDNAVFRCSLAPAFEVGGFLRGVDGKGDAGADEADVATGALVHAVPQFQRVHHQRQLAFVAITGPDPAPVPARLFVPDTTLLAECDAQALIDQFERRRGAHDPAADNDNVDLCR